MGFGDVDDLAQLVLARPLSIGLRLEPEMTYYIQAAYEPQSASSKASTSFGSFCSLSGEKWAIAGGT